MEELRVGQERQFGPGRAVYRIIRIEDGICTVNFGGRALRWLVENCKNDPPVHDFATALKEITTDDAG